jgi:hypothetical protein
MTYDDDWASCASTHVTLRIYPGTIAIEEVSRRLSLTPTRTQTSSHRHTRPDGKVQAARPAGWFVSSKLHVQSRDVRRHLDWLLDQLLPLRQELDSLRAEGALVDVSCYWLSAFGHGGPELSPTQASKLASLELPCWFDFYSQGS